MYMYILQGTLFPRHGLPSGIFLPHRLSPLLGKGSEGGMLPSKRQIQLDFSSPTHVGMCFLLLGDSFVEII